MRLAWVGWLLAVSNVYGAAGQFNISLGRPAIANEEISIFIAGSGNPIPMGGTVSFTINGSPEVLVQGTILSPGVPAPFPGQKEYIFPGRPSGPYHLVFFYHGDANYEASQVAFDFNVLHNSSVSRPVVSPTHPVPGQPVTLSVTVGIEQGTPGGQVTFKVDEQYYPPVPVSNAGASLTIPSLSPGTHQVAAIYVPGPLWAESVSVAIFEVGRIPTQIFEPQIDGELRADRPLTLRVQISPPAPGEMEWSHGPTRLGRTVIGADGWTTFTVDLGAGPKTIVARYTGSETHAPSSVTFVVHLRMDPTIAVAVAAGPAPPDGNLTFTATMQWSPLLTAPPRGVVDFFAGTQGIGSSILGDSRATLTIPASRLGVGDHSITAFYPGDLYYFPVTSSPVTQRIERRTTSTSLSVALASNAVVLKAAVTSNGAPVNSGAVRFVSALETVEAPLMNGLATFNGGMKWLGQRVTASYLGDVANQPSAAPPYQVLAPLNGFSFTFGPLAPNQIVTVFGDSLGTQPLVQVTPAGGHAQTVSMYYSSPTQTTFALGDVLPDGPATLTIANGAGQTFSVEVTVARTAPGIATASADGQGPPAAQVLRVRGGASTIEALGPLSFAGEPLYLVLYGTGFRHAVSPVTCTAGGRTTAAAYAGAQGAFAGLDQINLRLDAALAGAGAVTMTCTADGRVSNAVSLLFP